MNIRPKKSLGQNFLINPFISEQIVSIIKELNPSSLIEIGPGLGSLTTPLSQLNIPLTLIELDSKIADFWKQKKFSVIEKDALQIDDTQIFESSTLVGNLPYQISSRLVIQSSTHWPVRQMCLMVQKEVADRMTSLHKQKSYGLLSVAAQYAWDIQKKLEVKTSDFHPPPQVEGRILTFKRKNILPVSFLSFLKECFQQKRKILLKKIEKMKILQTPSTPTAYLQHTFDKLNISASARAEELSVDQFVKLYKLCIGDSHGNKNNISQQKSRL
ncbi:MAG: 16S rRNA (adenine(1518)-N(6)/adenine(1519)-N(6))-dimethyltransferase RsmA [Bdellovibrionales bacterium]|nr:16S rRNA (adenine(1518)-N(6)/adenine(1519)-N(6))-dimethyltransferase RsmA [Bdellovibrionales bacterium]